MKYIDADKLKAEIERLRKLVVEDNYYLDNYEQALGYGLALDDMGQFFDTFSEEPDKSLEEAANNYLDDVYGKMPHSDYHIAIFLAGAEWQANHAPLPEDTVIFQKGVEEGRRLEMEDIMKDAVEKTVGQLERQWGGNIHFMHGFEVDEMDFPFLNSQECGYGDKVRIIVLKAEEK